MQPDTKFIFPEPSNFALSNIPRAKRLNGARLRCLNKWGWNCLYCGCELNELNMTFDHIIPRSKGGKKSDNLAPACPRCNMLRGNFTSLEEFDKLIKETRAIIAIVEKVLNGTLKPRKPQDI